MRCTRADQEELRSKCGVMLRDGDKSDGSANLHECLSGEGSNE